MILQRIIGSEVTYLPERPGDPVHVQADISLVKNLLDWQAKTSLKEDIEKTKKWLDEYINHD